ncbi:MAG: ABC transporter ATP-binding protein [Alphaproteobacteria bacterium]|nr:ABC transporter ATP-binding protein [Alphaproteobacteria bacterium]
MTNFPGHNLFFLIGTAWRYAAGLRPRMILFYAMFLVANIVVSFQPVIFGALINTAQKGGPEAMQRALWLAALYGGLTVAFWMLHGPARLIERRVAFDVSRAFIADYYRKVTELPLRWHQDHHSGGTINRIRKAEKALFTFAQLQFVPLQIIVRFIACTVMLAFYSLWVAAASLMASAAITLIIRRFDARLIPLVRQTNESEHFLSAALYDYIGNIVTVLTLRMQGNTGGEIASRYARIKATFWREIDINEWKWFMINLLLVGVQAGITGAYVALHMAKGGALALGSVVAIFQYLSLITMQFFQGSITFEQLLYQSIDVRGVEGIKADHARLTLGQAREPARVWRNIRVANLVFTHNENDDKALHHLRNAGVAIEAGRKIAFIGQSGSGKSTFLTLLRGLYDAQSVDLSIDGEVFTTLMPLSGFTTLVPQDSEIFENTVRYNLTLGIRMPQEIVDQALAISAFDEVVPKLPHGLDTDIRERGVNLSGGQKQRLALARGIIAARDSSLLLLDEPTSSVDMLTESLIFERLFKAFPQKAVIASVHRLHLLPRFDHIVMMRDGAVVEQGEFSELLARQGEFARLWLDHLAQVDLN